MWGVHFIRQCNYSTRKSMKFKIISKQSTQNFVPVCTMCGNWTYLCCATDWTLCHILKGMHEVTISVTRSVTYPLSTWNSMTPNGPFSVRFYILDVHWNFFIKTQQSNRHCTWRPTYLYMILAVFVSLWLRHCVFTVRYALRLKKSWASQHMLAWCVGCCFHNTNYKPPAKVQSGSWCVV